MSSSEGWVLPICTTGGWQKKLEMFWWVVQVYLNHSQGLLDYVIHWGSKIHVSVPIFLTRFCLTIWPQERSHCLDLQSRAEIQDLWCQVEVKRTRRTISFLQLPKRKQLKTWTRETSWCNTMMMMMMMMMMMTTTTTRMMMMMMMMMMTTVVDARATMPLADPRLEQPAEWPLAHGPWEFVGTSAPQKTKAPAALAVSIWRIGASLLEGLRIVTGTVSLILIDLRVALDVQTPEWRQAVICFPFWADSKGHCERGISSSRGAQMHFASSWKCSH